MIIAITQARMSSSRCPGKVLKPILGYPMVWHQWTRMQQAQSLDLAIMATSTDISDDPLANYFIQNKQEVFRGSLNNVLNRYYECAKHYQASHVVRLTADCPLLDPSIIDKVVEEHLNKDNDYTSTSLFPVGMSAEVIRFSALEKAYYEAKLRSQREHVTLFIYQHPELFKLGKLSNTENLSHLRWTVDYPEDFDFVLRIYQKLYPQNSQFTMEDVLSLLREQPELITINAHMEHNGLAKSLAKDGTMTYLDD
ncbi:cytidylyltransferase domain-containing protein [Legionella sp. km772]|uniref:cytidylyltransferase domain-containing protein n=1 Tax=Legionella sp. km772 TaxID=2498111 RepID=UPI000F8E081A|nr:glycosyltransferase family protein [Legionella sp. km772]RUR13998.1 spore coat protein [Legionella sp. km772]